MEIKITRDKEPVNVMNDILDGLNKEVVADFDEWLVNHIKETIAADANIGKIF